LELKPLHFIGESIDVQFDAPLIFEKKPGPPDSFFWQEVNFIIVEVISEWHDYFRVRTENGRFFDLYYDRAPKDIDNRKGAWFLDKELAPME